MNAQQIANDWWDKSSIEFKTNIKQKWNLNHNEQVSDYNILMLYHMDCNGKKENIKLYTYDELEECILYAINKTLTSRNDLELNIFKITQESINSIK